MRLRHLALPSAAGLVLLAIPFAPAAVAAATCDPVGNSCTAVFEYTGAAQTFTVPAGVSNVVVALGGARGGDGLAEDSVPTGGGDGGLVEAIVPVTPGEVLTLVVGGKGGDAVLTDDGTVAAGGYGGGGDGSPAADGPVGAGGGGSFLFGSDGLLLATGGGGGAGFTGNNAGLTSFGGNAAAPGGPEANGGAPGGPAAGGAGGGGEGGNKGVGPASSATTLGTGGASTAPCSAGGGGGGFYGGGSGGCVIVPNQQGKTKATSAHKDLATAKTTAAAAITEGVITRAGGGGGGSGHAAAGVSIVPAERTLYGADNGIAAVGYTTAPTTTTLTSGVTTLAPGQETTINAAVDGPTLTIDDATAESPAAAAVARAVLGKNASALAAAVPTQPAPPGSTVTPGTACGTATPCTVTFFVNGTALGDPISVDPATGIASVVFTAGSDEGVREITARYDGNLYYLQSTSDPLSITVAGLANTGPSNVAPMLATSAALLLAGAGLVVFGRRRPQIGAHRAL